MTLTKRSLRTVASGALAAVLLLLGLAPGSRRTNESTDSRTKPTATSKPKSKANSRGRRLRSANRRPPASTKGKAKSKSRSKPKSKPKRKTRRKMHDIPDWNMQDALTLCQYITMHAKRKRALGRETTAAHYFATLHSLQRFLGNDIALAALNSTVVERYEAWMRSQGLCRNTTSFYMRCLRAIYNAAASDGLVPKLPIFSTVYTGTDTTAKRAASTAILKRALAVTSDDPRIIFASDMFRMSLFTGGMAVIDLAHLTERNLRNDRIEYRRQKPNQLISIRIEPAAMAIIRKYRNPDSPYLLPILTPHPSISSSKSNKSSPSPGKGRWPNAYDERRQYARTYQAVNRGLRLLSIRAKLPAALTMYNARHSWATIARDIGIATPTNSAALGQTSTATTEIYLAPQPRNAPALANRRVINAITQQ